MRDFKKLLKLTWKRYAIWLILLGFFLTLSNVLGVKQNIDWNKRRLHSSLIQIERYMNKESVHLDDQKIDEKYLVDSKKLADEFAEKYKLSRDMDRKLSEDEYEKMEKNGILDKYYAYDDFINIVEAYKDNKFQAVDNLTSTMSLTIAFIFILAMALTSIEESLNYYDFTRMLPWSKKKEFIMKVGICLVFGFGLFAINSAIVYGLVKRSVFSEIASFEGLGTFILKSILSLISTSLVGVSLGLLAGNFLGHMGLSVIAIGFIEWFKFIVFSFMAIFGEDLVSRANDSFYAFKKTLSPAGLVFLSLTNVNFEKTSSVWAGLAVALIIAIASYFLIGKSSAERSGYMVKSKVISNICKWSGILSLTSVLFMVTTGIISNDGTNIIINIIAYGLSLLISYKLFDILFKIRLKF